MTIPEGAIVSGGVLQGDSNGLQGNILDNASVVFNQNINGTYSGSISGSGSMTKQGTGILILAGTNTYSGGTTVSAGELEGDSNSLQGNILDDAAVVFNQNFNGTFNGTLTGSGSVTKQGSGTLSFFGSNTYTGGTTVQAGDLSVNGSLLGNVLIDNGGTFSGNAIIAGGGSVTNNGTVSPGNSIGTITISGNYTQGPTGTLDIEINPSGSTDLLAITGTASLNGTLGIFPDPGTYSNGETFTFLTSGGGVSGTFSNIMFPGGNPGGSFNPTVVYHANDVQIILEVFPPFTQMVTNPNAQAVGNYLDGIMAFPGTDIANVLALLHTLDPKELNSALDQLQPSLFGALAFTEQESATLVNTSILHRISLLHGAICQNETGQKCPPPAKKGLWRRIFGPRDEKTCTEEPPQPPSRLTIWTEGFALYGNQHHHGLQFGFHNNNNGVVLGADYQVLNELYLGALTSYSHTNVHWNSSRGKGYIHSYYGGLYATWAWKDLSLDASILGAYNDYETKRHIEFASLERTAKGFHNGYEVLANLTGAWNFNFKQVLLQPFFRLDNFYLHENGFSETSAQSLDLHVRSKDAEMLRNELGVNFSYCYSFQQGHLIPIVKMSWIRESRFGHKHYQTSLKEFQQTNGFFTVNANHPSRNLFSPGVGLTMQFLDELIAISGYYEAAISQEYWQQDGSLNLEFRF